MDKRILVVEDESILAFGIQDKLESYGYTVSEIVSSGEEAIEVAEAIKPDLVLMDINLDGEMNGIEASVKIKERVNVPVVYLTAYSDEKTLEKVKITEPFGYIIKPFEDRELRTAVEIALYKFESENKLKHMLNKIERNNDDLTSIFNQLNIGTAIIGEFGHVMFMNNIAHRYLQTDESRIGAKWDEVFSLNSEDKKRIKSLLLSYNNGGTSEKLTLSIHLAEKQRYWIDVEVREDPRKAQNLILYFYDVTEVRNLRQILDVQSRFHNLIGKSSLMQSVYQHIMDISNVDSTVLINGETGTGKELVANAIHNSSKRKAGPFIAVNCAGFTDSLLESQLFGHRKGAFTGALSDNKGVFEEASGGTLFLDEIGDISVELQSKLLRVLQEREITRIGENKPLKIDVRIIAATNKDLEQEVKDGNFRADLLYRIRVARIELPALRKRREDIAILADQFLSESNEVTGKNMQAIDNESMQMLQHYDWPGNVRELKNIIEFAAIRARGEIIRSHDLPPEIYKSDEPDENHENEKILNALKRSGGNKALAAKLLGIGRTTLYRRLSDISDNPDD